nr:MAG TPA: hypothetical protein [Caudoviricetes sp.]DAH92894.1 MAG TPA: hypothetical protein [Caudoviricetes sp.]
MSNVFTTFFCKSIYLLSLLRYVVYNFIGGGVICLKVD